MGNKTHSELSPSNTERWWNCPGSIAACKGLKQTESDYAKEGTCAHEVLTRCLKDFALSPFDFVGNTIEEVEVTEEMAEAVLVAVDFVKKEIQENGGELCIERKLTIIEGKIFGELDIAIVKPFEWIKIVDYKHGKGVLVRADDNKQLLMYLLGASKQFEFDTAELIIIQPRVMTEEQISRWGCNLEYLETYEQEMLRHVAMTEEKDALLLPGDHCKFCLAKANCPALRSNVKQALVAVGNREVLFPDVKVLTVDVLAKILDHRDLVTDWLDAVSAYAKTLVEEGQVVPGYELAKRRAHRRWKDEAEVLKHFADLGDKIYKVEPLSPAALEKVIGKERKKEITDLIEIPDIGYTLKKVGGKKDNAE